ncbi:MAG: hypothetical protein ACFE9O_03250 [Promethearchaeota archaeon]
MNSPEISEYDLAPYIDELRLSSKTRERAQLILIDAEQAGLTVRKAPESLMAAALYIACILENERRTQEAIGQATGVSASTIQTGYKQLVRGLSIQSS